MRCDNVHIALNKLRDASFNPYWVFQCAATNVIRAYKNHHNMFQSLLGFPMRCDRWCMCDSCHSNWSFNPYWVFQCAATQLQPVLHSLQQWVSIPIGFSNALRQGHSIILPIQTQSFNPYWVFQCAATSWYQPEQQHKLKFQSLLGFPMRCDFSVLFLPF